MGIGQRMQAFLDGHGHSYRQAEAITGISNDTIRRICKGYEGPTTAYQVGRFVAGYKAAGYRVEEKQLLEGRDPRGDFEWTIAHAPAVQRITYMSMTVQQRVHLALTFLGTRYPELYEPERLSAACSLPKAMVDTILCAWESAAPDITTALALADGITRITGISTTWFRYGWLDTETPERPFTKGGSQACYGSRAKPVVTKGVLDFIRGVTGCA